MSDIYERAAGKAATDRYEALFRQSPETETDVFYLSHLWFWKAAQKFGKPHFQLLDGVAATIEPRMIRTNLGVQLY